MAFGLLSTETIDDYKSSNSRRKVFYQYPTGAAPLMGLLSMLPDEETDKPAFAWWERRFPTLRTQTVASGTAPFLAGDGTAFGDGSNFVANTEYRVNVVSTSESKATHVIEIREVLLASGSTVSVKGTVTAVISATVLKFRPYSAYTGVQNATTENNGKTVAIIGTANAEGARSGTGIVVFPTGRESDSDFPYRVQHHAYRTEGRPRVRQVGSVQDAGEGERSPPHDRDGEGVPVW